MSKHTISHSWGFGAETVGRFADAMKEARDQAPKAERWKLTKDQSHIEMARGALGMASDPGQQIVPGGTSQG